MACTGRGIRRKVWKRDGWRCYLCGHEVRAGIQSKHPSKKYRRATIDHVIPKSKGGIKEESNLKTCCDQCNNRKGDMIFIERLLLPPISDFEFRLGRICVDDRLIESGKSNAGSWNSEQLKILGAAWPPKRGWKKAVIGRLISEDDAERFVQLKGVTKKVK